MLNLQISRTLILCFSFSFLGCATSVRLKSSPAGARIELVDLVTENPIILGETPLQLSKSDISDKQASGPYRLRISKEGFASKEIIFGSISAVDIDLNFELTPNANTSQFNFLIEQLFEAQALAQKGDYNNSMNILNELQKINAGISSIYEMRASLYMVKGEYPSALRDLKQALSLKPGDKNLLTLMELAQSRVKGKER